MESNQNIPPGVIFARRVKEARKRRDWSQQTLADRLTELGYPMTRVVLTKLEAGKRQATLEDIFAFAVALGVAPVHLLVALDVWLSELPASEQESLMKSQLTRGASPLHMALMDQEKLDERSGDLAWE